ADHEHAQRRRQQRRHASVLQCRQPVESTIDAGGRDDGDGHAQTFSISGLPSSPVGRKISTMTSTANAATSLYSLEQEPAKKTSIRPISRPPSMAPGSEPMPPSTAAVKALMPARKPTKKSVMP